jgi:hypothetical protein
MLTLIILCGLAALTPVDADRPPGVLPGPRPALTYSGPWEARAPLPRGRAHHMVASFPPGSARAGYVFGGRRSVYGSMDQTCLRYDPASDGWTELAPMPRRRGIGRAVAVGSLIYVLGGSIEFGTGLPVVDVYDPACDSWTAAPNLPEDLHDFAAAAWHDSLILLLGGGNWAATSPPSDHAWLLDPATGACFAATPLPIPLGAAALTIIGDDIFLATGWTDSGPTNRGWHGSVNPDRPTEILWEELDTLPSARRCRAVAVGEQGRLLVIGGVTADGSVSREVWELEPATGSWSRLADKPTPVSDVYGAGELVDWLVIPGGYAGTLPYRDECEARYRAGLARDVALRSVVEPRGRLTPGLPATAAAAVFNHGRVPEAFPLTLRITDTLSGQLVFAAESLLTLPAGAGRTVTLGSFLPGHDRVYSAEAWTSLAPDENRANDTGRSRARTTRGSDPDGFGYIYESTQELDTIGFRWHEPTGGDTLTGWYPDPDDGSVSRTLPFGFPFYGETLTVLRVSVDGFIAATALVAPINQSLPAFDLTSLLAPFWHDLTLRARGAVIENRSADTLRLTWSGVPRYGLPAETLSFQVSLVSNGTIVFNYLLAAGTANSTVGIQGGDGGWGLFTEYCFNGEPAAHRPADSVSIVFHPPRGGALAENATARPRPAPVFPSPWTGRLLPLAPVATAAGPRQLTICDAVGRRRAQRALARGSTAVELVDDGGADLPPGVYFLHLSNPGDLLATPTAPGHKLILLTR